jgi:general secretion pathway protein I
MSQRLQPLQRGEGHSAARHRGARGFTLIEVIVALFVVALGMGALLATLTSSADSIGHLRNRSFAQWIALNRITEVRLSGTRPPVGRSEGEVQYAGSSWRWRQDISNPGIAGMLRIDVAVTPGAVSGASAPERQPMNEEDAFSALGSATGFLGTAVAPPNTLDPDWTLAAATSGPGPNGGGSEQERDPRLDQNNPPLGSPGTGGLR